MSEIQSVPKGWVLVTLEDVCSKITDGTHKTPTYMRSGVRFISIKNIKPFEPVNWESYEKYISQEEHEQLSLRCNPEFGDILFPRIGTLGYAKKIDFTEDVSLFVGLGLLKPFSSVISPSYLEYWMNHPLINKLSHERANGSGRLTLPLAESKKLPLPLAPKAEQERIVDKIDELFSELDAGVQELEAAQIKLKHYRQSLLKSAVEGALTQKWRDDNKHQIEETGKELLNRILIERKQRWEQNKLEEFKEKGRKPPKNWQDKYPEPVQPDTTDLPKLPEGWVWASISQIGWLDRGRSKNRPRNAAHLYGGKYPFVQTGEIRAAEQYIRETDKTYSEDGLAQSKLWSKGTMCITIAANIGETAILDIEACFPDSIVGFNCVIAEMPVEYVEYYFRVLKSKLNDEAPATAQKNINLEILSKEVIPLPPIKEQLTIVESLNNELESIKWQQASIKFGLKQSEAQRINILKSAFSGQLVPQDPNDEPASVLLEKIKQERVALAKIPKPRKQSKPRKRVELMNTLLEVLTAENDWIDAQNAFQKCGIVDGTSTDRIEEIYTELRKLEKTGRIEIRRQSDFDQLKLTTQDIKED